VFDFCFANLFETHILAKHSGISHQILNHANNIEYAKKPGKMSLCAEEKPREKQTRTFFDFPKNQMKFQTNGPNHLIQSRTKSLRLWANDEVQYQLFFCVWNPPRQLFQFDGK